MEFLYLVITISILVFTIPLGSRKLVYAASENIRSYDPLRGLSVTNRRVTYIGFATILAVLMILCIFRPETLPDYRMYLFYYDVGGSDKINRDVEPTFGIITRLSPTFLVLLGIYALLSVGIHLLAILKNAPNIWLSILIYLLSTFVLHDMIQMRSAVAISIMLISVRFIKERKWYLYFPLVFLAISFHYSTMVFLAFYFIPTKHLNKWIWSSILIVALIAGMMNAHFGYLARLVPVDIIQHYLESYVGNKNYSESTIGPVRFIRILFIIIMLFNQKSIASRYPYFVPVILFSICSQLSFLLLGDIPVLQGRFGEMFGAFDMFSLAMFPLISKKHYYLLWIVPIIVALYNFEASLMLLGTEI